MRDSSRESHNVISGLVRGSVLQAGSIQGGVHVHVPRSQTVAPRQLPPAPVHFASRQHELALMQQIVDDCVTSGRSPFIVLTGSGGTGKSALALRWLHTNANRYPDGQLYADLRAFTSLTPEPPTNVLTLFLRALGVSPEEIPLELAGQSSLYRSVTAGKSLAVFADDAESAAQVRPLLPSSPDSVVVVTSRWRLGGLAVDGGHILPVDPLDEASAVELLSLAAGREKIDREPGPTRELVQLCGGLPIALRVAAARLSVRPQWSIARVVDTLVDEQRRLASLAVSGEVSVQANFDLSYRELSADAARLYRLLGLHPGPDFGPRVAAAGSNLSRRDTEDLLSELVDINLLNEATDDRYRFHDLLRVHAEQHAERHDTDAERAAAELRMVTWYLDSMIAADVTVLPRRQRVSTRYDLPRAQPRSFPTAVSALDWMERELPNLVAAQLRAMSRAWWEPVWQMCEALWGLFLYRKHFEHWIQTHSLGIDAAHRCGNPLAESRLSVQLGFAHLNLQRHDAARDFFTKALELSRSANDRRTEATALEHLGLVARSTGRSREAMALFTQALTITEELGEQRGVALHLRRLGETLNDLGREHEALTYLHRAVTVATDLGDAVLRARGLTRLASTHTRLDQPNLAVTCLHEAVEILIESGSHQYLAEALETLAEVYLHAGDRAAAREHLQQAFELYDRAQLPRARQVQDRLDRLAQEETAGRPNETNET